MNKSPTQPREGSLDAPTRHPLNWKKPEFYSESELFEELERVYDICHGCRRCVSLCDAFPTLFDLVDESETFEVDGVAKNDYWKVVDECYLCDLCYQVKCPYVPPHEWNIDFPHLMLRAKAIQFRKGERKISHKLISSTDMAGKISSIPIINQTVNAAKNSPVMRKAASRLLDIHPQAHLPDFHRNTLRKRLKNHQAKGMRAIEAGPTRGRVALFATCYCNFNEPGIGEDLVAVFEHNGIPVELTEKESCCGMPKLEQGDLETVNKLRQKNIPQLVRLIDEGLDIVAAVPSCVLMFKQELPLLFPDDEDVLKVKRHIFDPFEYLLHRHKAELLSTEFRQGLGTVAWHVPCHQRVQNIGPKTKQVLSLIPGTEINAIERCSGHDGTYGVRNDTWAKSQKIARPVINRAKKMEADYLVSDCPMAATQIADGLDLKNSETNPMSLLRKAYGI
ncbi:MAG: heterodisulfide reductase-related iron-sulfur binding cluster [Xanthomonadales bacterium]|nr:heterodisulfide reductase-related iron-sulfur binding cluster [Xanthomonadales bacterium]